MNDRAAHQRGHFSLWANNRVAIFYQFHAQTLPKALRTQVLTALTRNFGLVGLVQYAWKVKFDLVW